MIENGFSTFRCATRLVLPVVALGLGCACAGCVVLFDSSISAADQTHVQTVDAPAAFLVGTGQATVAADQEWQAAGIETAENDVLRIRADGAWADMSGGEAEYASATGVDGPKRMRYLRSAANMSLIGRIGEGKPFAVGDDCSVKVEQAGPLWLRVNDATVGDNTGFMNVTIERYRDEPAASRIAAESNGRAIGVALSNAEVRGTPCEMSALPPSPEPRVSIAVLDLTVGDQVSADVGRALADLSRDTVHGSGRFLLVDRESIVQILGEEDFMATLKCDNTRCLVNYGRKLRAQKLIHGRVSRVGSAVVLTLKLLDVGSGAVEAFGTARVADGRIDRLLDIVEPETCALLTDALHMY